MFWEHLPGSNEIEILQEKEKRGREQGNREWSRANTVTTWTHDGEKQMDVRETVKYEGGTKMALNC